MFANARSEDSAANAIWVARGVLCCCSIIPLTICGTFCGLYWNLMNQANDYDDAIDATINDQHPLSGSKILPYDNCALGLDSQGDLVDTKWSVFLAFNSFLYLALCCCVVLMLLGTFFMPFWCCGCCGAMCGGIAHLAALVVTGVFRFSKEGEKCAEHDFPIGDGVTFKDHGETTFGLFISQCVLYIVVGVCMGFITGFAGQLGGAQCALTMGKLGGGR